jgi:cyclomaltodextrinase / maltogenic alpha-amylase / neopullulanase
MIRPPRSPLLRLLALLLVLASVHGDVLAQLSRDVSREQARTIKPWIRDGVIYEIFPRAFSSDGNFNGITARLDDLKNLGVTILWLMPIHIIGQEKKKGSIGSPYAVRDYYSINPDYGTKEDLKRLVTKAHERGLKVIIDIVANHTSWDSVMMKNSEYYKHDAQGKIIFPYDWSDVAWLNYENSKLRDYMIEVLKYWIREFDLDGFRCDVAGEVPVGFWEQARAEIEKIKPEIVMIAEASKPDLLVKAFELDYAWPLHSALNEVLMHGSPATAIRLVWEQEQAKFPRGAMHMLFSDNHDETRAIARFGERGALAASVLALTLDGVPMLYNGMEAGDSTESGAPALFERLPIFWGIVERRRQFPVFFKQMISLRRDHHALRRGETIWLHNSDEQRVVSFLRKDSEEELLITINMSNRAFAGFVEVANAQSFKEALPDSDAKNRIVGLPALNLDSWGFRIFRRAVQ